MTSICTSCKQTILNPVIKKQCVSCDGNFCSNCLYQRIAVPKFNYQMHEVCSPCFHAISTQMMLQKPPKNFVKRLEQQQPGIQRDRPMPVNQLDPDVQALEERLRRLRETFPATSSSSMPVAAAMSNDPDDLIRQMNEELNIQQNQDQALADRIRVLHETLPAATPDTVILPSATKKDEVEENAEEDEFPWCTVCNDNATKRCLDCDELFCESCVRKIHRQSGYKNHELQAYRPSDKIKKKYRY